jgi:prostaglandin-E synthase 1
MHAFLDNPALALFALTGSILAIHLLLIAFYTGAVRVLNKGEKVDVDHPDVQRVKRAHQNAIENFVPFLAVGLFFALTNPSITAAKAYFFTFLAMRVLHSIFYLWGRQPFRTMTFAVGALAMIGMGVQVIMAAI